MPEAARAPHWMGEVEQKLELDWIAWDKVAQEWEDEDDRRAAAKYSDERSESWPTK